MSGSNSFLAPRTILCTVVPLEGPQAFELNECMCIHNHFIEGINKISI
jgi:hypothetical protein